MLSTQKILSEYNEAKQILTQTRIEHVDFWQKIGFFKQQSQQQLQMEYKREKQAAAAAALLQSQNGDHISKSTKKELYTTPTKDSKISNDKGSAKSVSMSPNNPNKKFAGPSEPKNIISRRKSSVVAGGKFIGKLPNEPASVTIKRRILQLKGKF